MRFDHGTIMTNLRALKGAKNLKTADLARCAGLTNNAMARVLSQGGGMTLARLEDMIENLGFRIVLVEIGEKLPDEGN